ncbi:MAG: hypothetical protein QM523_10065 [Candidatus Pacebacteria bacterium]|nr:hypothetical protein [Candidatus Paceibacterota bacterium]
MGVIERAINIILTTNCAGFLFVCDASICKTVCDSHTFATLIGCRQTAFFFLFYKLSVLLIHSEQFDKEWDTTFVRTGRACASRIGCRQTALSFFVE